ncbi:hypothetical protein I6E68_04825 [Salinibacterium sp. NSLL150]|uniref:hypothetical protein n=1 Tax=unclassified Salinibacterium TaxID=2632331 RepID=UPI0018CFCF6A|nr:MULTISPECIES: hypothetical protein [unclassified Salinibacterium]MBH0098464.1 hypothetical protein [Salinibacterium sp. NSLL35]MBH0101219.1 hypothetical protein [Salinibacterium sp. NSLL150]MBH0103978.1 hypothetical protein [Salinibacterium sp. NSLL16]MBH0106739.1 hypothetical protein [Salinibacterium sp. NSLL17]
MKIFSIAARIWIALALLVNAYVHFVLATPFDAIVGSLVSQGALFRIQGVMNILAAVLVLAVYRWWTGLVVAVIAAGGLALLVASVYVPLDLSAIGLPVIYEPVWYSDKVIAVIAQGFALIGGVAVALLTRSAKTQPGRP